MINRNGIPIRLRPKHLVMAIGILGDPKLPPLPGSTAFSGTILHTSAFQGGKPFAGQRVIVVGAGNSSVDICQDLVVRGAKSVTMVQRSATAVVSDKFYFPFLGRIYSDERPTDYSDLVFHGMPLGAVREVGKKLQIVAEGFDKEMHEGLRQAGFKLTSGPYETGIFSMFYDRGGGTCICRFNSSFSVLTESE